MVERLNPDICVIGAGSGGLSVAAAAAAFGVSVVLIEKGKMGGDCLNFGCVPSKSLIAAAKRMHAIPQARAFGITAQKPKVDFPLVNDHVHDVIAAIAPNDSAERFTALGVRVIAGEARFADPRTVKVGDDIEVAARRFVIATGSSAAVPSIPGLDDTPYLTNETVFDLRVCPKHLIVIGCGPIGLELAQAFCRLGAQVTVLEAATPLAKADPECAALVLDEIASDGVTVRSGVTITGVKRSRGKVQVKLAADSGGEEMIEGSDLLVAAGRKPNIDDLGLDEARIKAEHGGIVVDRKLKTTNRHVYAIGDVAGGLQFTHVANYHAGLVVRHALFRLPVKVDETTVPWVVYTDPELAHVGLAEEQARQKYRGVRILRWPYHENDRAQAERATRGHIKVVTTRRGRILGATIVGAGAGELITTWSLAIAQGLNIRAFAGLVIPYPTLAEIGKRAATTYFTPSLTSGWVRRFLWLGRRLG